VNAVFDGIGGWNLVRCWRALTRGGRLVAYGLGSTLAGGRRDLGRLISSATGSAAAYALSVLTRQKELFIYSIQMLKRRKPDWFRQDLMTLFALLARGDLKPLIDRRLGLEEAALAQELVAKGNTVGKIVLINPEARS
jgi:NADPH2:quinone reductase